MNQPWAWVSWVAASLVMLSITRNPLYLVLILLCILVVAISLRRSNSEMTLTFPAWKFAGWIIALATVFNALTSHYGGTILFTIPGRLPLVSGNVTLEALVYGATNGLILTGMIASFTVLNLALRVRALISLVPRAFFPVAVVTTIAVSYLPTTLRQFQQIREAQAVRGHQVRTLRDWLPLLMPLLVGGLEHAMQLAEAMTARGFASSTPTLGKMQNYGRYSLLVGVGCVALGWILQLDSAGVIGLVLISAGTALILFGVWYLGRGSRRTSFHQPAWSWQDLIMVITALAVILIGLAPIPGAGRESLYYEPYPVIHLPGFSPLIGVSLLALAVPGLLMISKDMKEDK